MRKITIAFISNYFPFFIVVYKYLLYLYTTIYNQFLNNGMIETLQCNVCTEE